MAAPTYVFLAREMFLSRYESAAQLESIVEAFKKGDKQAKAMYCKLLGPAWQAFKASYMVTQRPSAKLELDGPDAGQAACVQFLAAVDVHRSEILRLLRQLETLYRVIKTVMRTCKNPTEATSEINDIVYLRGNLDDAVKQCAMQILGEFGHRGISGDTVDARHARVFHDRAETHKQLVERCVKYAYDLHINGTEFNASNRLARAAMVAEANRTLGIMFRPARKGLGASMVLLQCIKLSPTMAKLLPGPRNVHPSIIDKNIAGASSLFTGAVVLFLEDWATDKVYLVSEVLHGGSCVSLALYDDRFASAQCATTKVIHLKDVVGEAWQVFCRDGDTPLKAWNLRTQRYFGRNHTSYDRPGWRWEMASINDRDETFNPDKLVLKATPAAVEDPHSRRIGSLATQLHLRRRGSRRFEAVPFNMFFEIAEHNHKGSAHTALPGVFTATQRKGAMSFESLICCFRRREYHPYDVNAPPGLTLRWRGRLGKTHALRIVQPPGVAPNSTGFSLAPFCVSGFPDVGSIKPENAAGMRLYYTSPGGAENELNPPPPPAIAPLDSAPRPTAGAASIEPFPLDQAPAADDWNISNLSLDFLLADDRADAPTAIQAWDLPSSSIEDFMGGNGLRELDELDLIMFPPAKRARSRR